MTIIIINAKYAGARTLTFVIGSIQLSFRIYHCVHPIATCKDVFNPNITTFKPNCAEGLHFSAFHLSINLKICDKF